MGYIDLHVHSNKSDGLKSVRQIMHEAMLRNVTTISFTEHYNLSSYLEATKQSEIIYEEYGKNIEIIKGIEVGTDVAEFELSPKKHKLHLTVYFPSDRVYKIIDEYEEGREKAVKRTITALNLQGINITYTEVKKIARDKESIGRLDIAAALVRRGAARNIIHAYSKYLDNLANVEHRKMFPTDSVKTFCKLGGVVVLAHPNSVHLAPSARKKVITQLVDSGLSGIEAYGSHCSEARRKEMLGIANEFDLIPTVGSDYHGRDEIVIGHGINENLCIDNYEIIERLKEKKKEINDTNSSSSNKHG